MITRLWSGVTTVENADAYETLLRERIFPGILARDISGFLRIELNRRPVGEEVEFVTIMWFTTMEAVRAFAGESWDVAVVPPPARTLLKRFDERSRHYEVRESRSAAGT